MEKIQYSEAPLYFASRALHSAERNYSQFETEILGIIFGITIVTDCKSIIGLLNPKKPIPDL